MRRLLIAAVVIVALAVAFATVTLVALESRGVAILHTMGPDGGKRRTRVWFAESGGSVWIEAATAERPFYVDIATRPVVALELRQSLLDSGQRIMRGKAERVPEPRGHRRVRELLAEKYGWADTWIGLLQDTSASRAIRIAVRPGAEAGD